MAIKVQGSTVISDARALNNVTSIDATTKASFIAGGVGGKLLQVVQSNSNTSYSFGASTSFQWATNHNVSITPSSTSSKILITVMGGNFTGEYNTNAQAAIFRGTTKIQGASAERGGRLLTQLMYTLYTPLFLCVY